MPTDDSKAKANGEVDNEEIEEEKPQKKAAKHHDSGAADLERVTDFAEEQEISSQDINRVRVCVIGDTRGFGQNRTAQCARHASLIN